MNIAPLMRIARHLEIVGLLNDGASLSAEAIADDLKRDQAIIDLALDDLSDAGVLLYDAGLWRIDPGFASSAVYSVARDTLLKLDP